MNLKTILFAAGVVMLLVGVARVVRKHQAAAAPAKDNQGSVAAEAAAQTAAAARQHIDVDFVGGVVH